MAILGDKIDNVPGIPGVGEVTAAALVRHFGTVEAMLARPEEIPKAVPRGGEKLREKIVAGAERIRLNRKLVELKCDVPIAGAARRLRPAPRRRREGPGPLHGAGVLAAAQGPARPAAGRAPPRGRGRSRRAPHSTWPSPRPAAPGRWGCGRRSRAARPGPRRPPASPSPPPAGPGTCRWDTATWARRRSSPSARRAEALRPLLEDPTVAKHGHDLKAEIHALAPARPRGASGRGSTPRSRAASCSRRGASTRSPTWRGSGSPASCRRRPVPGTSSAARGRRPSRRRLRRWPPSPAPAPRSCPTSPPPSGARSSDEGLRKLYDEVERPLVPVLAAHGAGGHRRRPAAPWSR